MTILKVTYDVMGLFSLKRFGHGHLNAQSYPIPMKSTIRGAILGQMIQLKGKEFAEAHYEQLRDLKLFIQYPEQFEHNQVLLNRITNRGFAAQGKIQTHEDVDKFRTVGIRDMVHVNQIVFYIEDDLEGLSTYLKSIQIIGDSESHVGLRSVEEVKTMTNVLMPYSPDLGFDSFLEELWDWSPEKPFEKHYGYSHNRTGGHVHKVCYVEKTIEVDKAIERWK